MLLRSPLVVCERDTALRGREPHCFPQPRLNISAGELRVSDIRVELSSLTHTVPGAELTRPGSGVVEDEQRQRGTLQGQQLLLAFHPAGVALHRAVRADDPVAGADDSQRVRADRGTDSLDPAARDAELSGQRTVGRGRAVRDGVQGTPDQLLEIGSGRGELEVKDASLTSSLA
jgi:hypothetical protein